MKTYKSKQETLVFESGRSSQPFLGENQLSTIAFMDKNY